MARMIPQTFPASCPSPGEREIFTRLMDEPSTMSWIVLHSLDIAHHLRQVSGEVDFVIIVPSLGVLCLEVKACYSLRRKDGLWFYGQSAQGDPRGPFKQSAEGMHSLRQQVIRANQALIPLLQRYWLLTRYIFKQAFNPDAAITWSNFRRCDITSLNFPAVFSAGTYY